MKGLTPAAGGAQTPAPKTPSKKAKKPSPPSKAAADTHCCPKCGATIDLIDTGAGTYMQLDRMMRIHETLRLDKFPSQSALAKQLGYGRKRINSDMKFMQDRLKMALAYIPKKRGWGYTQPMVEFPLLHVTEQDLMALCVAAHALGSFPGTPFAGIIRRVLEKFRFYVGDRLKYSLDEVQAALSFGPPAAPAVNSHVYEEMIAAAFAGEEIGCLYGKLAGKEAKRRVLQPVHVTARNGAWYVLVQNREKEQKIATYKLSRASEVQRTGKHFEKLPREEWEKPLANCIGIYLNVEPQRVRLRVTETAAKLLTENPIHPKQEFVTAADGTTEVTFQIGITPELESRILDLRGEARVLEPITLRKSVGEIGRKLAAWADEADEEPL